MLNYKLEIINDKSTNLLFIHYYFSFDYRCKGTAIFAKHQKWACTYLQKSVNKTKFLC